MVQFLLEGGERSGERIAKPCRDIEFGDDTFECKMMVVLAVDIKDICSYEMRPQMEESMQSTILNSSRNS